MHKKIAVLAGDGIGPEVMQVTLTILDTIAGKFGHQFEYLPCAIGGHAYDLYQTHCPAITLNTCEQADAILFGSVGGAINEQHLAKWQNCETNSILKLRQHFNFTVNMRPIAIYPALLTNCPLKPELIKDGINFVVLRELTGGLYFGKHELKIEKQQRLAIDECCYDEIKIKTIAHAAFQTARLRNKRVCSVDKANVLATSKLWRDILNEIAKEYADIQLTHMLIDNCAMQMILNPQQFDVIVTENMFGDILSDLAAALPGSLGLIPSISLNDSDFGLYEPSGGSAPDIAGKNLANPSAQILSAALMLQHSFGMKTEAQVIEKAVTTTIGNGILTYDISKDKTNAVTTSVFAEAINAYIKKMCAS